MFKEVEQIQQLKQKRSNLTEGIKRINNVYLSDSRHAGGFEIGTSVSVSIEVGRTKIAAKKAVTSLNTKLELTNSELANDEGREYLERDRNLKEMDKLIAEGVLPEDEDILNLRQKEADDLSMLLSTNPFIEKSLEQIKQKEEEEKVIDAPGELKELDLIDVVPATQSSPETTLGEEKNPEVFTLQDGEIITGQVGMLLYYASKGSKDNRYPIKELIQKILPGIDYKIARQGQFPNIVRQAKKRVQGKGIELIGAPGKIGGYYLEIKDLPSKQSEAEESITPTDINIISSTEESIQEIESLEISTGSEISTKEAVSPLETQKPLSKVEAFIQSLNGEAKDLFEKVTNSTDFVKAKEKASEAVKVKNCTMEKIGGYVAGYLFETMAYLHLYAKLATEGKFLLSPEETLEVYSLLYPTRKKVINGIGLQTSLNGISVPDGIIFDRSIAGISEYSLSIVNERGFSTKLGSLDYNKVKDVHDISFLTNNESSEISKYIHNKLPNTNNSQIGVSDYLNQFTVFPMDLNIASDDQRIEIIQLPVNRRNFREFINALMSDVTEEVSQSRNEAILAAPEAIGQSSSIETPEFAGLSRAEIALIALRLDSNREDLERLGIKVIDRRVVFNLIDDLTGGHMMNGIDKMTEEERDQFIDKYRATAFIKAKRIIKGPKFSEFMDRLPEKYAGVRALLENASKINEILENAGQEGITIIADDPEQLKMIVMPKFKVAASEKETSQTEITPTETGTPETEQVISTIDESVILYSGPFQPDSSKSDGKPTLTPLEKRNPNIIAEINTLLDEIERNIGLNKQVSAIQLNRIYNTMKQSSIDKAVEHRLISFTSGNHGYPSFDASAICALLYLRNHDNLPSRLQKQVQDIAEKEVKKRQKTKNGKLS